MRICCGNIGLMLVYIFSGSSWIYHGRYDGVVLDLGLGEIDEIVKVSICKALRAGIWRNGCAF